MLYELDLNKFKHNIQSNINDIMCNKSFVEAVVLSIKIVCKKIQNLSINKINNTFSK